MRSEIVLSDAACELDAWAEDLPSTIITLTNLLARDRGREAAEEFIVRVMASVAGAAIAALGQERACELIATQLQAAELA